MCQKDTTEDLPDNGHAWVTDARIVVIVHLQKR